jgi:hypothetical protein
MQAEFERSTHVAKNTGRSSLEIAPLARISYLKYLCKDTTHNITLYNCQSSNSQDMN